MYKSSAVNLLRGAGKAGDAGEDLVSGFGPDERFGLVVCSLDEIFDGLLEL